MHINLLASLGRVAAFVMLWFTVSVNGQVVLIDPSTRNGSFENGVLSPWVGFDSVSLDADYASDGLWYAVVSGTQRTEVWQDLSVDPFHGFKFEFRFDYRWGTPRFDTLSFSLTSWNADGTEIIPFLSSFGSSRGPGAWTRFEGWAFFPSNMDGSTFRLALGTRGGDGISTSYGYFDNIVLEQVPEPSIYLLLLVGSGAMIWCRFVGRVHNLSSQATAASRLAYGRFR